MQADTIPEPTDPGDAFPAKFFRNTFPVTFGPPLILMLAASCSQLVHLDLVFNPLLLGTPAIPPWVLLLFFHLLLFLQTSRQDRPYRLV